MLYRLEENEAWTKLENRQRQKILKITEHSLELKNIITEKFMRGIQYQT